LENSISRKIAGTPTGYSRICRHKKNESWKQTKRKALPKLRGKNVTESMSAIENHFKVEANSRM